jgi:hypothetical protein
VWLSDVRIDPWLPDQANPHHGGDDVENNGAYSEYGAPEDLAGLKSDAYHA